MKELIEILKRLFYKRSNPTIKSHQHTWRLDYRTGNAEDGKSDVCRCECGKQAVRHYGTSVYILLD
jgi:hypothetical protein